MKKILLTILYVVIGIAILAVIFLVRLSGGALSPRSLLLSIQIRNTIHVEATDVSSCKVASVGHKACGGPSGFIVYSQETTDVDKLSRLLLKQKGILENYTDKGGGASTCDIPIQPVAKLVDGMCVAGSGIPELPF